jgi:hypothetical protein
MPSIAYVDLTTNQGLGTVSTGGTTAPVSGTTESWTVNVTQAFPAVSLAAGTCYRVTDPVLQSEIFLVTVAPGGTGAGQSWSVTRGAEGTTPVAHAPGFTINGAMITAAMLAKYVQGIPQSDGQVAIAFGLSGAAGLVAAMSPVAGSAPSGDAFAAGYTGQVQAFQPGSSPLAVDAWHNVTPPSGWSGLNRYKRAAQANFVIVDIQGTHAGASGNVTFMTLPAGYIPASTIAEPMAYATTGTLSLNMRMVFNASTGVVNTGNLPSSTTQVWGTWMVPLD